MRGILGISVNNRVEAEDARWLLSMAGLSDLDTMVSLEGGWDNSNFHLRLLDGSEVVLKAWFANTLDEVSRVIKRHLHLDSHGIATTVPIQMLDGHYVAVKDGFAWTLLPFVKGGFLGSDEDSLRSLGETLARMHSIPNAECFPREYRMGFVLFEEVVEVLFLVALPLIVLLVALLIIALIVFLVVVFRVFTFFLQNLFLNERRKFLLFFCKRSVR